MTAIDHGITSDLGRKKPSAGNQDVAEDLRMAVLGSLTLGRPEALVPQ